MRVRWLTTLHHDKTQTSQERKKKEECGNSVQYTLIHEIPVPQWWFFLIPNNV
jgi:hypothetical protein